MGRLPIRWRVTLAFAATLLVVLGAVGAFLYLRFEHDLSETLDRSLQARAGEVAALVRRSPAGLARGDAPALEADESVAQVLRTDGTVVAGTAGARTALLSDEQLRRARRNPVLADRDEDDVIDERLRVLAVPVRARGESLVAVVGASLDEKDESVSTLLALELLGLGAALLVASAAGYVVSGSALRPVEAMRRRAEEIADEPDQWLPVPEADDEIRRLGTTLNAMLDRLSHTRAAEQAAMAKERRFIADASHELRTPLAILKGEIEVALLADRSVEELRAALRSGGEETDRLWRLAEDLLVLSQSDEGLLPIRSEPVDLAELLESVAHRHRAGAEAAGRRLEVDAPEAVRVNLDRMRIEQALTNLVDNALRHGDGDVLLSARAEPAGLRMAVRDHGPGFADGFAARAFERFSRADSGRTGAGAGLGLAIVQAVAAGHGGSATATAAEPGARVEILLPAALIDLSSSTGHSRST